MSFAGWRHISLRRLILVAALLHIILVLVIFTAGKWQLLPQTIDNNGVGIAFALDSASYREEAVNMANLLRAGSLRGWFEYDAPLATFHARIYSICFVVLGPFLGQGILAIEPINLFYFLSILVITYKLGASTFSDDVGRIAFIVVGLWPSLLIFSTQLLRDPLYIGAFLLLLLNLVTLLKHPALLKTSLTHVAAAYAALILILLVRSTMWEIVMIVAFLAGVLCLAAQVRSRQVDARTTVSILLICVAVVLLPRIMPGRRVTDRADRAIARQSSVASGLRPWSRVALQIGWARQQFVTRYSTAGSNIDTDVEIKTVGDVVRYLPRAMEIGLFAPFPNMWFSAGSKVGLSGRLWIGAEMFVLYFCICLAVITAIRERGNPLVWFLIVTTVIACLLLALVVVNVGALYRLRYTYFIPIILLAIKAAASLFSHLRISKQDPNAQKV